MVLSYRNQILCLPYNLILFRQQRFIRRTVKDPPWVPPTYKPIYRELKKEDREFVEQTLRNDHAWKRKAQLLSSPSTVPEIKFPDCTKNQFSENSKRIGLIGRKIGMTLQWWKDGTRVLCTMIHIPENHVLSAIDPDTWFRRSIVGKRKAFGLYGPSWSQMVGAMNDENPFYTDIYKRKFERICVPVKKKIANFLVSEDAIVNPGTKLDVRHFSVGQCVTVCGKSVDWGFQGAMHRWGFKGMPKLGTTKSHRRLGSTGSSHDAKVWPGKRMHGHMGYAWKSVFGLQVIRINPIKQVIYVVGCTPGDQGEWLLLKDSLTKDIRPVNSPFPTYYESETSNKSNSVNNEMIRYDDSQLQKIYEITSQDIYHPNLFKFSDPSIVYSEADETKSAIRDKTRAKTAKIRNVK